MSVLVPGNGIDTSQILSVSSFKEDGFMTEKKIALVKNESIGKLFKNGTK